MAKVSCLPLSLDYIFRRSPLTIRSNEQSIANWFAKPLRDSPENADAACEPSLYGKINNDIHRPIDDTNNSIGVVTNPILKNSSALRFSPFFLAVEMTSIVASEPATVRFGPRLQPRRAPYWAAVEACE